MTYVLQFRDVFAASDALLAGLALTLQLTASTLMFGFLIGLGVAAASVYGTRPLRTAAHLYVETIRNSPLLVQLFILYFGLPSIGVKLDVVTVSAVGLAVNLGAYAAEIIRAGIESIPKTQIEAGAAIGLSKVQLFRHVVLLPALEKVFPSLRSQFILLMLATSVVSQIAAPELFYAGSIIQSRTYRDFEVYIVIAVLYLALALLLRGLLALGYHFTFRRR